jgi:hypothetical protein
LQIGMDTLASMRNSKRLEGLTFRAGLSTSRTEGLEFGDDRWWRSHSPDGAYLFERPSPAMPSKCSPRLRQSPPLQAPQGADDLGRSRLARRTRGWLELQSFCQARSEGVLDMINADLGALGEDTDHVEAQGFEVWLCGVEVVLGYGAQGILLAGGDGFQWVSEAGPAPQLDFHKDECLGSLVQNTMTSEVRFRATLDGSKPQVWLERT